MKKICFAFNHLQYSDGVSRVAIGIANHLAKNENVEVTLRPIFRFDKSILSFLDKRVIVKPVFGFYVRGFAKILEKLPGQLLYNLIFGHSYDIVIGFQYGVATVAAGSFRKENSSTHFLWMHTYDEGLKYLKFYQKVDSVVCVSKCNSERLKDESNQTVNAEYCYNPIDDKVIQNLGNERILDVDDSDGTKLISVGRLSYEKGYDRLLNCFEKLKEMYKFQCLIIGDGPSRDELQNQINNLGLQSCVKLLGEKKNPHAYTAKSDLFICSSRAEGYSTACTEAIILGIPVISTNVSGAEEIISEAEAGLVVDDSEEGLLEGLEKILKNPSLIKEWKNTITTTKSHFSYETRVKKLDTVLGIESK